MKKKYELIIFDFDGTIASDMELAYSIQRKLTNNKLSDSKMKKLSKFQMIKMLKFRLIFFPIFLQRFKRLFSKKFISKPVVNGLRVVLDKLYKKSDLLVLTSTVVKNPIENISKYLKIHKIDYFSQVYFASIFEGKTGALRRIMKEWKVNPEDVLYVGDEVDDIEACKRLGVDILAVSWGFTDYDSLSMYEPEYIVKKPEEILEIL
jgi:phosphoglycolate phosphatase